MNIGRSSTKKMFIYVMNLKKIRILLKLSRICLLQIVTYRASIRASVNITITAINVAVGVR